jgi:hypothetical protein
MPPNSSHFSTHPAGLMKLTMMREMIRGPSEQVVVETKIVWIGTGTKELPIYPTATARRLRGTCGRSGSRLPGASISATYLPGCRVTSVDGRFLHSAAARAFVGAAAVPVALGRWPRGSTTQYPVDRTYGGHETLQRGKIVISKVHLHG